MKFLSPEFALYLFKSSIRPCMEYCCLALAGACSCYLDMLDKLHKRVFRNVGLSLLPVLRSSSQSKSFLSVSLLQ